MAPRSNRYVALLRAVNVGGTSVLPMAALKELVENLGLDEVSTYIQSGNVLFRSPRKPEALAREIAGAVGNAVGRPTDVFVLAPEEIRAAIAGNPFDPARREKTHACHLLFLSGKPAPDRVRKLMELQGEEYRFAVKGAVLYYTYAKELRGNRRTIDFERVLGVRGTARTWKVAAELLARCEG